MTWLEIRPQDVWLFRDGKPFSAGEDHSAQSMFPPSPLTVQGAIRQKISVSLGASLWQYKNASKGKPSTPQAEKAVAYIGKHGDMSDFGQFSMRGPFVSLRTADGVVPLLPVPADLLMDQDNRKFYFSKPDNQSFSSDMGEGFCFPEIVEHFENLPGYWMTGKSFADYLENKANPEHVVQEGRYADALSAYQAGKHIWHSGLVFEGDNRFGVSTNALTSFREEGQLYQVQFVRPKPGIGLLIEVNSNIPQNLLSGAMIVGGEQRQATSTLVDEVKLPTRAITKRFKVIFLTPAYFDDGWQPKNGDWSSVFGHPVTLKSANVYRPLKIGGWSNADNRARPMYNYVAPGSVYYFETAQEFSPPHALTHSPDQTQIKALGFGQYAIGQW